MSPSFFIAGPPKCASSSLYFYLNQHPEILMSLKKETRFFSNEYEKGLDFYLSSYFPDRENVKVAGEATPSYSFLPFAAKRIANHFPNARFIFSFRHPAERAYSGWLMRRENGSETLDFLDSLEANVAQDMDFSAASFEKEWLEEHIHWKSRPGEIIRTYVEGSQYIDVLNLFEKLFDKEHIHVVITEDLRKDLDGELKGIYRFLGVDESFQLATKEEQNTFRKARFAPLIFALKNPRIRKLIKQLPGPFRKKMASGLTKEDQKPRMSDEERAKAVQLFLPMVNELEKRLGRDLKAWKK
jgi:hypothetical protein